MPILNSAKAFVKDFIGQISRRVEPEETKIADDFFKEKRKEVISSIINHPVSSEIRSHIAPSRILGPGVRGSLYGFMGFPAGTKPIDTIVKIVEQKMTYKTRKRLFGRGLLISIIFPTLDDFRVPELLLPYEGGGAFPEVIERGAAGLNHYVQSRNAARSRSREGLQSKRVIRQRNLGPIPYLTPIFARAQRDASATIAR